MGLQKCGLNLNRAKKELQPHGTFEFPCAGYSADYTNKTENIIPWHWHDEMEIVYVKDGTLKLKIPGKSFLIEKGCCLAINSNILHYAIADPECELNSLVFSPTLITGNNDSVYAKKYVLPLTLSCSFNGYLLSANENKEIINHFISAFQALAHEVTGYEFIVREHLSSICFFLYQQFENEIKIGNNLNQDNLRIKKMLDYIHYNYSSNITLSDIAKVADIGERECLRCFQRTIQHSPMQYLQKYRIMQSADLLVKNPTSSISEISILCGFNNPSYYTRIFRRFYKLTPKEYRNLNMG